LFRGALIITPEYPPRSRELTASKALNLAVNLRDLGVLTSVIVHDDMFVGTSIENGVRVARVGSPIRTFYSILTLETFANTQFIREGEFIITNELVDVIFSFEWSTLLAAISLKSLHQLPLVSVIQSVEPQRTSWKKDPLSITIENFERTYLGRADLVVTDSTQTYYQIRDNYRLDETRTFVVDLQSVYWVMAVLSLLEERS